MSDSTHAVQLNFRDDPEMYEALSRYKNMQGWTWKRLFLMGTAEIMAKNGENPDLILRVIAYLEGKR